MAKSKFDTAPKFGAAPKPGVRAAGGKPRRKRGSVSPRTREHDAKFFGRGMYGS